MNEEVENELKSKEDQLMLLTKCVKNRDEITEGLDEAFNPICWPWLGIDQIKFQGLLAGESDGQNGAKFRKKLRF